MNTNCDVNLLTLGRRGLAWPMLLICGLTLAAVPLTTADGALAGQPAGSTVSPAGFPRILSTEFRGPLKDGWEAFRKPAGQSRADRPWRRSAEYGLRVEKGTLSGPEWIALPLHYYRVQFREDRTEDHVDRHVPAADGHEIAASVCDSVDPSPDWQTCVCCVRAHPDATHLRNSFESPLSVQSVLVEEVWLEGGAPGRHHGLPQCPLIQFEPAPGRWRLLPRTIQRLATAAGSAS